MKSAALKSLSVAEARAEFASALRECEVAPVQILRRGEPVAVLVSSTVFEKFLDALEELEDIADVEAIQANEPRIPWESVKRDLGLS